jgi:GT2 family glycosyltransferase
LAEGTLNSLYRSFPKNREFGLIALDTGSTDGTYEYLKQQIPIFKSKDLNKDIDGPMAKDPPPNVAIELWLGKYDKESNKFEKEDELDYLCWIHSDMDFICEGWLDELIRIYETDKDICFLSPSTSVYPPEISKTLHQGNSSPLLISVEMIKNFYKHYGYFLEPKLFWCVAYDDWDMHFRVREMGYKSLVTPTTTVIHYTGGTTLNLCKLPGWNEARRQNLDYYKQRWGTECSPFTGGEWGISTGFKMPNGSIFVEENFSYKPGNTK